MGKQYAGNIKLKAIAAYQNSLAYKAQTMDPPPATEGFMNQFFYIPNLESIPIYSDFDVAYYYKDTEKERPIFYKQIKTEDLLNPDNKVNLGTDKITFMCYPDYIGTYKTRENGYREVPSALNESNFSVYAPGKWNGQYLFSIVGGGTGSSAGLGSGGDVSESSIKSIKYIISSEDIFSMQALVGVDDTGRVYRIIPDPRIVSEDDRFSTSYTNSYIEGIRLNNNRQFDTRIFTKLLNVKIKNKQTNIEDEITLIVPNIEDNPISNTANVVDVKTYSGEGARPNSFGLVGIAFAKDAFGKYWIICVNTIYAQQSYSYVSITRADNLLTGLGHYVTGQGTEPNTIYRNPTYLDPETYDINEYLDSIFGTYTYYPPYEDDAPDAVGPGDDGENNNSEESIGGNENIVDTIEPPETTPNDGINQYLVSSGLFGSYVLNTSNLTNYSKTMNLYTDLLKDSEGKANELYQLYLTRIKENTTSIFSVPFSVPAANTQNANFIVGNRNIFTFTGDSNLPSAYQDTARIITSNYFKADISLPPIEHYYDNFLDFEPYSSATMHIPYIGKVDLPLNLIQSTSSQQKNLRLELTVDLTNADMLVTLIVDTVPISSWTGNCGKKISLTAEDSTQLSIAAKSRQSAFISAGATVAGSVAAGLATGGPAGAAFALGGSLMGITQANAAEVPHQITSGTHKVGSPALDGTHGWLSVQDFTIIVERPIMWKPYDYGSITGYPTRKVVKLGSIKGYAKIEEVHLRCSATESEKKRLKEMLKEGVNFGDGLSV